MSKKICIITGANAGIGKAATIQMLLQGYHVIMGCRNQKKGLAALKDVKRQSKSEDVELFLLDLSLKAATKNFAEQIKKKYPTIDVLIHNAAIFDISQKEAVITLEGYESVWMTNHINPMYLTYLLMDNLKAAKQARVITIASKGLIAHPFLKVNIDDPEFKHRHFKMDKAYYQSKLAQIMFTYYLADKLKNTNVTVNGIRVTAVKIASDRLPNISKTMKTIYKLKSKKALSPEAMAKTYVYLASFKQLAKTTGKYFDEHQQIVTSSKYSQDSDNIKAVMDLSFSYFMDEIQYNY